MKFAFQMDAIEKINFLSDSSWELMKESLSQGHEVYFYPPQNLFWENGKVLALLSKINIDSNNNYKADNHQIADLTEFDVIFIRQDPPYDMNYLTTTYLLEKISDKVLMVNNPRAIRDFPEKISVLDFAEFIPATIVTENTSIAHQFALKYSSVIAKPLYSFGGQDVFFLQKDDEHFFSSLEYLLKKYKTPFILQEFISDITTKGDKRIILIDGEPLGVFTRKPQEGSIKSNLAAGGSAFATELSVRNTEICNKLGPFLKKNGLFFAGIDIINGYLIEINITSPTGLISIKELYNHNLAKVIIEKIVTNRSNNNK